MQLFPFGFSFGFPFGFLGAGGRLPKARRGRVLLCALAIELLVVWPGIANSRIRALPHVHLRSQGPRHSFCRVPNEEFYIKKRCVLFYYTSRPPRG